MGVSYATIDASKMELTPMQIKFKGPGAASAIDLGGSLGGVTIDTKYEKAEIKADQMGTTVLDRRVKGVVVTVTAELAEIQNKDIWKIVFPHANLVVNGTNKAIEFQSMVGDSDLANAGELTLHPLSKGSADVTGDYLFFKACASAESSISATPDGQQKLKVVWTILPDTSVSPARFYIHGDPALAV